MHDFRDPIFKGCTRPAMFLGVPMIPFLVVTGIALLLSMWMYYLISPYVTLLLVFAYIPTVLWMRQITKKDDQRLRQMMMRARMRMRQRTGRVLWGAYSFSPIRYKHRRAA
jgi:type IV secretion system protein VirB3